MGAIIPLGLADLDTRREPVRVGARLLVEEPGRLTLGDALRQLTLTIQPSPTSNWLAEPIRGGEDGPFGRSEAPFLRRESAVPREGDWVIAELAFSPSTAEWICHRLELATRAQGKPSAPRDVTPLQARANISHAIADYFRRHRFVEIGTPTFGRCPGLDPYVHSLSPVTVAGGKEHLMTSPEFFMKRLLADGLSRIYQIGRAFRSEEQGPLHEPEFTLVEWYRTFEGVGSIMADVEQLVVTACKTVRSSQTPQLFAPIGPELVAIAAEPPFEQITVREAFSQFAGVADAVDLAASNPDLYFQTLVDHVDPGLTSLRRPIFLTEYPETQAGLAQRSPKNDGTAERFELVCAGVELANGYQELTSASEQRSRFEQEQRRRLHAGEPCYPLDEKFLGALEAGIPPSAGVALGLDRLVSLALGSIDIQRTLAFPISQH